MTTELETLVKCYRCGYCGQPTDVNGIVLSLDEIKALDVDWEQAEQTHGECCAYEQERQMVQVTREMAIDAGSPEMEGAWIEW